VSNSSTGFRRIGLATDLPRGSALYIPRSGYSAGGGGEYGATITDDLRTFAITREPVAHRVVFTVAHDIFDNWFTLELEGDEKGGKSKEFDKQIQTQLQTLKAKRELTKMAVFERAYGWAILVLGYEQEGKFNLTDPLENPVTIRDVQAYSPTQIKRVDEEKNKDDSRYGLPVIYNIKRRGIASYLKVHYTRVIHFATRLVDHDWKGQSVLDPIWDDLVTLRNIRWGMGQTMYRYGSGFPDIEIEGATKDDLSDYENSGMFKNLSNRTYFLHSEKQKMQFIGTAGRALDPMNYYVPPMEHISAGTGIPLAILRGVQAGALTGSEVNQQEYYGLISDEQSAYEHGIRELIKIILSLNKPDSKTASDVEAKPVEFEFNWQGGFELDEEKKARIEQMKVATITQLGQFLKRNELRAKYDPELPELTEEEGGNEIIGRSPQFNDGENAFHVKPHTDGSATVRELRKHNPLHAYR